MCTLDTSFVELQKTRAGGLIVCMACGKKLLTTWPKGEEPPRCPNCNSFTRLAPNYEEQDRKKEVEVIRVKRKFVMSSWSDKNPPPKDVA